MGPRTMAARDGYNVARNRQPLSFCRPFATQKPRVLPLSGEILIGSAIIAISLLYASRTLRAASRRAAPARGRAKRRKVVEIKRNSVVGSRAANNGDTVTSGIARRADRYNTVTVPFVPSPFVILYIFITALHHTSAYRCILSRSRCFFFSFPPAIFLRFPFPRPRIPISGCHPSTSTVDAFRADLLGLKE